MATARSSNMQRMHNIEACFLCVLFLLWAIRKVKIFVESWTNWMKCKAGGNIGQSPFDFFLFCFYLMFENYIKCLSLRGSTKCIEEKQHVDGLNDVLNIYTYQLTATMFRRWWYLFPLRHLQQSWFICLPKIPTQWLPLCQNSLNTILMEFSVA